MSKEESLTAEPVVEKQRRPLLLCLVGAAGSGKTTVADRLLKQFSPQLMPSVSVTSRAPRPNEVEGQSYFFISREEFQERLGDQFFFESEEIHGNLYGTGKSGLNAAREKGIDTLLTIDIRGAINVKKYLPNDTVIAFIAPRSRSTLVERLRGRGSISEEELTRRMKTAEEEYEKLMALIGSKDVIDYVIVNEDVDEAFQTLASIYLAECARFSRKEGAFLRSLSEK